MAMVNRAGRVAVLLLLAAAAFAAEQTASQPSFNDVLGLYGRSTRKAGMRSVSVASVDSPVDDFAGIQASYDDYGVEEKEICLTEIARRACSGPANDDGTGPLAGSEMWTSDLACCKNQGYGGYGGWHSGNHIGLTPFSSVVGSCDWVAIFPQDAAINWNLAPPTPTGGAEISAGVWRLGAVSATCYLGGDAHECGLPNCERMVFTLQGSYYFVEEAYSMYGATDTRDASCVNWGGGAGDAGGGVDNRAARGGQGANGTGLAAGAATRARATPRVPAQIANNYYGGDGDDYNRKQITPAYKGPAFVLSGMVSSIVGKHNEQWQGGCFEYVPYFRGTAWAATDTLDANAPWIRDNTYKLTLWKSGGYYGGSGAV